MIRSIVRAYHWTPTDIEILYLDDRELYGLEYWYNDVMEVEKSMTENE